MSYPLSEVLQMLAKGGQTLGWDVVVAYNADAVNDLFAQQYVLNLKADQFFPPVSGSVSVGETNVRFDDIVLGPPLISFPAGGESNDVLVTMNFVSGSTVQIATAGNAEFCTGYQTIAPGAGLQMQMTVPLADVTGSVTSQHAVQVSLDQSTDVSVQLVGSSGASILGTYFQNIVNSQQGSALTYQLGTLVTGTSGNLTPYSFDIHTQPGPTGAPSEGAVLLLVATTYNEQGGSIPGSDYPYLIPDTYRSALLVANKTVLENIFAPGYRAALKGDPQIEVVADPSGNELYTLEFTGGSVNIGVVTGSSGQQIFWSGGKFSSSSVKVPYAGISVGADSTDYLLSINWKGSFRQNWSSESIRFGDPTSAHATIHISGSFRSTPAVVSGQDEIAFSGSGSPSVSFSGSSTISKIFGSGSLRDKALHAIAGATAPAAKAIMNVPLPDVNAFAVSHLLFPQENALTFTDVAFPGDLAIFGDILPGETAFVVTPLQTVVAAGATAQFAVANGANVTWSVSNPMLGSISSSGLFTAPQYVPLSYVVVVTATGSGGATASAAVTVVPNALLLTPGYWLIASAQSKPVTIRASVAASSPSVAWSLSGPGTLAPEGDTLSAVYTPPSTFPSPIGLAQITVSLSQPAASAVTTIALAGGNIAFTVTPPYVALGPGATQQFALPATITSATWSVLAPAAGSVSASGLYMAPAAVTSPLTDVVMATVDGLFIGLGVVALTPPVPQ